MKLDDSKILQILVDGNYLAPEDAATALEYATKNSVPAVDFLITQDLITKDLLGQSIAESYQVAYSDLNSNQPSWEQVEKIPEEVAKQFRVVFFAARDRNVIVTTDDPSQDQLEAALKQVFPTSDITITYSLGDDIDQTLLRYQKPLDTRFSKIIKGNERIAPEILEEIFEDAYTFSASDIHFEPKKDEVIVRFRVDGVLQEAGKLDLEYYENILNRIKVQSHLRIDEHFAAQDGSMRYEKDDKAFDLRTSVVPTVTGEKVVIRILAAYIQGLTLGNLGLAPADQKAMVEASKKPFGMILVVGPTGSGKTTSLYAVLRILNRPDVNITTIEDPVEYKIPEANQIQVNTRTNLTFSEGLRSIVRQDPDIILVGEIRDEETAEIAVNAALTGHLLLSTFHANDAATAIPRLLDMNIEPFLLASTLEVIVAQRLVRKICDVCRYSVDVSVRDIKKKYATSIPYFKDSIKTEEKSSESKASSPVQTQTLYAGKGCTTCSGTGYRGRTAIFEFIQMTPELQDLVLENPSTREIWKIASRQGSHSLFADGIEKVKTGVTTLEELMRVATPPKMS